MEVQEQASVRLVTTSLKLLTERGGTRQKGIQALSRVPLRQ